MDNVSTKHEWGWDELEQAEIKIGNVNQNKLFI